MFKLALGRIKSRLGHYEHNVILAHCFAAGSRVSESETGFIGTAEQVGSELFAGFDYAALGHLHSCQSPGPFVWYSGAPLAFGVAEGGEERGYIEINLDEGKCRVEFRPLSPKRKIRKINGYFDELLALAAADPGREDFVEFQLVDEEAVLNAAERLKAFYPRLLSVRQRAFEAGLGAESKDEEEASALDLRGGDSLEAVKVDFIDFYRELKGSEPSDKELALFEKLAKEAADASE